MLFFSSFSRVINYQDSGYEVEFTVYKDDEGRYKCKTVSAADGSPCVIPKRPNRKRGKGGKKEAAAAEEETNGKAEGGEVVEKENTGRGGRQPRKRFDTDISDEIKQKMKAKKFDMRQNSLLVTIDKTRLKFGPEGYAALAHADGILAEGSFTCDEKGDVAITWKNMLKYEGDEWKSQDAKSGGLVDSFNWSDGKFYFGFVLCCCCIVAIVLHERSSRPFPWLGSFLDNVEGMKKVETPEALWGEGKTDESKALESNKFEMRKCFLAKVTGKSRGKKRRPRTRGGKKAAENGKASENGEKKAEETKTSS